MHLALAGQYARAFVILAKIRLRAFRQSGNDDVKLVVEQVGFRAHLHGGNQYVAVFQLRDDGTHDGAARLWRVVQSREGWH